MTRKTMNVVFCLPEPLVEAMVIMDTVDSAMENTAVTKMTTKNTTVKNTWIMYGDHAEDSIHFHSPLWEIH